MPGQALRVPGGRGSQISRQSAHEGGKFVSSTHRPSLLPGNIPGTHFCCRLSQPQGHSEAGRIMSMKESNDTIGNRTRDLPTCSAVPQPTAPPAACPGHAAVSYIIQPAWESKLVSFSVFDVAKLSRRQSTTAWGSPQSQWPGISTPTPRYTAAICQQGSATPSAFLC